MAVIKPTGGKTKMATDEQTSKYLLLARRAREEKNTEDAKRYYDMVRTDDPDCAEARFFYAYYRLLDGKNGEVYGYFDDLTNIMSPLLRDIALSESKTEDKESLIADIYASIAVLPVFVNRILNDLNRVSGNNGYMSQITSSGRKGMKMLYNFGDDIEKYFPDNASLMKVALEAWKAGVYRQQQWYGMGLDKSLPEVYTAKIKKFDPGYELPKKAGCISFSK